MPEQTKSAIFLRLVVEKKHCEMIFIRRRNAYLLLLAVSNMALRRLFLYSSILDFPRSLSNELQQSL